MNHFGSSIHYQSTVEEKKLYNKDVCLKDIFSSLENADFLFCHNNEVFCFPQKGPFVFFTC